MVTPRQPIRFQLEGGGHRPVVDPDLLLERPDWWPDAACRAHDLALWFSDDKPTQALAKAICRDCPVVTDCAAYALADPSLVGIFGALTTADRRRLRGAR